MEKPTYRFTSHLKQIDDFLRQKECFYHPDVHYMGLTRGVGVFEDRSTGSYICLEFNETTEEAEDILFCLKAEGGAVHD